MNALERLAVTCGKLLLERVVEHQGTIFHPTRPFPGVSVRIKRSYDDADRKIESFCDCYNAGEIHVVCIKPAVHGRIADAKLVCDIL